MGLLSKIFSNTRKPEGQRPVHVSLGGQMDGSVRVGIAGWEEMSGG